MLKNIYSPLSGSIAQERVLSIIANNLANATTTGFKQESVSFKVLDPEPHRNYSEPLPRANFSVDLSKIHLKGNDLGYVGVSGVHSDFTQGAAIETGNSLDIMLEGDGFLTIQTKEGARYSRAGSLSVSADGALVDKMGNPVLGEQGVIYLSSESVEINTRGEVYQGTEFVDRLLVKNVLDKNLLERVGQNYYHYSGPDAQVSEFPAVRQGYLEGSNVNAIENLTKMILAQRSFEAYQKTIKNFDSMMEKSSNSIGVVRG